MTTLCETCKCTGLVEMYPDSRLDGNMHLHCDDCGLDGVPDFNSATVWYNATKDCGVQVPKTFLVPSPGYNSLMNEPGVLEQVIGELDQAAQQIGYPVFVRSDGASAKHSFFGVKAVKAESKDDLALIVGQVCELHAMAYGLADISCFMVREWLPVKHTVTMKGGQPIGREYRAYTWDQEWEILPYWTPEPLRQHVDDDTPDDWEERLMSLAPFRDGEEAQLRAMVEKVHAAVVEMTGEEEWSIDLLQHEDGSWYLIDMALAKDSFHPTRNNPNAEPDLLDESELTGLGGLS